MITFILCAVLLLAGVNVLFCEVNNGVNELSAAGNDAIIIRKNGEKIPIPSNESMAKLHKDMLKASTQKAKEIARKKYDLLNKKFPKIMEGDTVISGENTLISVRSSYNIGKDKPLDGMKSSASKSIYLGPNSEVKLGGIEKWSREDKNTEKKYVGELLRTIEVKKVGLFFCSYSNCEDELLTPTALIQFIGLGGSITCDYYNGALYCVTTGSEGIGEKGSIKFTNKNTKKSFTSTTLQEVIITNDSIYRKGFAKMDEIDYLSGPQIGMHSMKDWIEPMTETMDYGKVANNTAEAFANMEMLRQMDPKDLVKLAKQGGASKEQLKQLEQLPQMMKMMDKEMPIDKLMTAAATQKAFYQGMGEQGLANMASVHKEANKKLVGHIDNVLKDFMDKSKKPRNYGPLKNEFKVA